MATEHTILKAYKFRIYPKPEQVQKLNQTFGCARVVWNKLVENFNAYGTNDHKQKYTYRDIREDDRFPWLKDVSAAALQRVQETVLQCESQEKDRQTQFQVKA